MAPIKPIHNALGRMSTSSLRDYRCIFQRQMATEGRLDAAKALASGTQAKELPLRCRKSNKAQPNRLVSTSQAAAFSMKVPTTRRQGKRKSAQFFWAQPGQASKPVHINVSGPLEIVARDTCQDVQTRQTPLH